jgi:hypothetical protein
MVFRIYVSFLKMIFKWSRNTFSMNEWINIKSLILFSVPLTHCIISRTSREADSSSGSQESSSLMEQNGHRRALRRPSLVSILSHVISVHTFLSYLFNIRFNIILESTPGQVVSFHVISAPKPCMLFCSQCVPRALHISPSFIWPPLEHQWMFSFLQVRNICYKRLSLLAKESTYFDIGLFYIMDWHIKVMHY